MNFADSCRARIQSQSDENRFAAWVSLCVLAQIIESVRKEKEEGSDTDDTVRDVCVCFFVCACVCVCVTERYVLFVQRREVLADKMRSISQ